MATQTLRPPNFSEDVAWVPCWLQNIRTNGFDEYVKESQAPSNQAEKDLTPSQENGIDVKDFNVLSREEGGYQSCHLLLSGDDCSSLSVAPSPGNMFQFRLHLSSDVDSVFCPTHDFNQSHHSVTPSKSLSLQAAQSSVDFRENAHSMMDYHACEQDKLAAFIPETVKKDAVKSLIDTFDSLKQEKEKSKVKGCKSVDISDAVELSIAASEALVIHDLVKMESVSERFRTEAVLEVALRVKQARLEGMEDGFHFSSEESDCSDSLSDLNDFLMEDAYENIGLSIGASFDENICNSAIFHKGVSGAENYNGCNNIKHSDREFTSQLANFDDNSKQKQLEVSMEMQIQQNPDLPLDPVCSSKHSDKEFTSQPANFDDNPEQKQSEVNMEIEIQQNSDLPLDPVCGESEMHSDDPDPGANTPNHFVNDVPISHQHKENNTNVSALNQTDGLAIADLISVKPQDSVNSSLVETSGNSKNENLVAYLAPERFRSRWFGGWTCKELHMSSLNRNNAERIPMCVVRETSFLTESVDNVPDESSCVLKHDPKYAVNSQLSMSCEGLPKKPDESVLHSQDVVRCSSLSSIDPLCSVVPCSIASEHDDYKTHIDKENDTEYFVPSASDFEVDKRISDKNATFDCRDKKIMSVLDKKHIPVTATEMAEQMCEKLTRVEHTCLRAYSMILPDQAVITNCNLTPCPTNQSIGGADASLGTRVSESLPASNHTDENNNEVNRQYLIDQKSLIEITEDKNNELKATELTQERRSPLILNHSRRRHLVDPKAAVNGIGIEKNLKLYVVQETSYQHQQNNNPNRLQIECNGEHVRVRKRVHFSEKVEEHQQKRKSSRLESSRKRCSSTRPKRQRVSKSLTTSVPRLKHSLTKYCRSAVSEFIFRGIEFLLTGLSSQQERDLEAHIRNSGGVILSDIPSPNSKGKRSSTLSCMQLPIILCKRKLQTTKFLYGCAVGASILKVDWLTDCLASGTILQPENCIRYMILPNRNDMKWTIIGKEVHHRIRKHIFERVGIMLHGKHSFCTKFTCIIKHGGGQVFKTLQWLVRSTDEGRNLVGTIVVEDMITISRHLKSCALEWDIPIMPFSWIIKSLYSGKLLPFAEENNTFSLPFVKIPKVQRSMDMSEEI